MIRSTSDGIRSAYQEETGTNSLTSVVTNSYSTGLQHEWDASQKVHSRTEFHRMPSQGAFQ